MFLIAVLRTATSSQAIVLVHSHCMFLKGLVNPTLKQMKYLSSDNPVITLALKKNKKFLFSFLSHDND